MSQNTKIFQLYFKDELKQHLDPAFEPMSNVDNPRPHLREWCKWDREHESMMASDLTHWGYVSWKFKQKSNLDGDRVMNWISANPGYDAYLLNPCIVNEALFANGWEQGDIHHPGISDIGNKFFSKMGYGEVDCKNLLLDRTRMLFANYVVGSRQFWELFMKFTRALFTEADLDPVFKEEVFGEGRSNYAHDKSLPNFTFLIERFIPTFLELEGLTSICYPYTADTLDPKYTPYAGTLSALSNLKVLINQYEDDALYDIWNHFRHDFLQKNPGVLGLE